MDGQTEAPRSTSARTETGNMAMVAIRRLLVKFEHGPGKSIAINKIKF